MWRQVTFDIAAEAVEAAAALLGDWPEVNGVVMEGVSERPSHPNYGEWYAMPPENPNGATVTVYVPESVAPFVIRERLHSVLTAIEQAGLQTRPARETVRICEVDPADWENAWKDQFHAHAVGRRLTVIPKWEAEDPKVVASLRQDGRLPVILEPGMAFGTGLHETSQICLEALEAAGVSGARVLDVGCGTGILAIAAARLGALRVDALDIDPVAVIAATDNVRLNQLSAPVTVTQGDLLSSAPAGAQYDVIVANLLRDPVLALAPQAAGRLLPGGRFITSGYIEAQEQSVRDGLATAGLVVISALRRGDWVALTAVPAA